jgi:hypothetical protein
MHQTNKTLQEATTMAQPAQPAIHILSWQFLTSNPANSF